ncbi:hypothetical protein T08_14100 [Trichinella sp. T8]|nr:hypothetical protein T08_14100 [Trichinella sp. T8]
MSQFLGKSIFEIYMNFMISVFAVFENVHPVHPFQRFHNVANSKLLEAHWPQYVDGIVLIEVWPYGYERDFLDIKVA